MNNGILKEISVDDAYINNTPSLSNFSMPVEREKFFDIYKAEHIEGVVKKYPAENKVISLLRKIKHTVKSSRKE